MRKKSSARQPRLSKAVPQHQSDFSKTPDAGSGVIRIDGRERRFVRKAELIEMLADWPKVVDRMLYASRRGNERLKIVSNVDGKSGSEVRVTAKSALRAFERLESGEMPPLMPSEVPKASVQESCVAKKSTPAPIAAALLRAAELIPKGVQKVTFHPLKNSISVFYDNGDFESIRRSPKRGRRTRVISVVFATQPGVPSPLEKLGEPDTFPPCLQRVAHLLG